MQNERLNGVLHSVNYSQMDSWKNQVMDSSQYGEPFLRFTITTIITLGAILKIIYQTYGMAGLHMFLIKGTKSLEKENNEI